MAVTYTITHTRPNTDTEWFLLTDAMQSRIDHFLSTGDLVSFNVVNNDELSSTTTIVFKDTLSEATVLADSDWATFGVALVADYSGKGITVNDSRTVT